MVTLLAWMISVRVVLAFANNTTIAKDPFVSDAEIGLFYKGILDEAISLTGKKRATVDRLKKDQEAILAIHGPSTSSELTSKNMIGSYYSVKNLLISQKYKLAFCPVEKVASSMFRQLFFRLSNDSYWFGYPWHRRPAFESAKTLGIQRINEIFNDPTWTKAIFFRDPALRLLSAYTHFFSERTGDPANITTISQTNVEDVKWEDFVHRIVDLERTNIHWNPQTHFCAFHKNWKSYNFIGAFENLKVHGQKLFDMVSSNLWAEFGAKGWSLTGVKAIEGRHYNKIDGVRVGNMSSYFDDAPSIYNTNDCIFCSNYALHKSNDSQSKGAMMTTKIWNKIRQSKFYSSDYENIKRAVSYLYSSRRQPNKSPKKGKLQSRYDVIIAQRQFFQLLNNTASRKKMVPWTYDCNVEIEKRKVKGINSPSGNIGSWHFDSNEKKYFYKSLDGRVYFGKAGSSQEKIDRDCWPLLEWIRRS